MPVSSFGIVDQLVVGILFLTRFRLPVRGDWPDDAVARSAWSFPLVGWALGVLGGVAAVAGRLLGLPVPAPALIGLGAVMLATGALHEDGLADTADGLGGGRDRAQKLEIMRDSRIGSYGALALLISVGLRVAALSTLAAVPSEAAPGAAVGAMAAAHAVSRAGLPAIMRGLDPARPGGIAARAGRPGPITALVAALLGVGAALLGLGWWRGIAGVIAAAAAMAVAATLARRQIGGYTGDVLGAAQQAAETAVLLVAAAQPWT
jgi:adenosylcobinamide-GDP ribazoletransferase